jgi:N-acetylmuramoyl-L-alanine amidase
VIRANRHGDAVLVSMHFNSGPSHVRGPETYYWRVDSHGLAVRLQRAMESASPAESANRGLVRRRLRLTRNPEIPCVLIEGGYLSNAPESHLIADAGYRQKLARAIAGAIRTQAANGDAGTGPLPRPLYEPPSRPTDTRE